MSGAAPRDEVAPRRGARAWFWFQIAIGWIPVWALYATLMYTMHGGALLPALLAAARAIGAAALLGMLVLRFTDRIPWPRPVRPGFVLIHLGGAMTYAVLWAFTVTLVEGLRRGRLEVITPPGAIPFVSLGIWLYVAVAGVSYAARATERAARAEAATLRAQLAALRSQLNPHFLFNALHTVVQLIPVSPERAAEAAELLAGLLRTATQEDRDLVTLEEELAFVDRYLSLERLRFDERLVVDRDIAPGLRHETVPGFTLQTLVENAVRHGAAPREEPTRVTIAARAVGDRIELEVADTGAGADPASLDAGGGTGLRRLRGRLQALFGDRATLRVHTRPGGGFRATVVLPRAEEAGWT